MEAISTYEPVFHAGDVNLPGLQDNPTKLFFRMVIQFSDKERSSNIFLRRSNWFRQCEHYKITLGNQDMLLALNENFSEMTPSGDFKSFLLTLLIEPPVFALMVFVLKKEVSWCFFVSFYCRYSRISFLIRCFGYSFLQLQSTTT